MWGPRAEVDDLKVLFAPQPSCANLIEYNFVINFFFLTVAGPRPSLSSNYSKCNLKEYFMNEVHEAELVKNERTT